MHEWANEDLKMMVWTLVLGDRLLRDLRDSAANDQTHLLAGGDVRHGTSQPPGPAEPADTGTAGMAARLGQPQQQRLIAGPLPCGQPRVLPRRSPVELCVAGRGCSGVSW